MMRGILPYINWSPVLLKRHVGLQMIFPSVNAVLPLVVSYFDDGQNYIDSRELISCKFEKLGLFKHASQIEDYGGGQALRAARN